MPPDPPRWSVHYSCYLSPPNNSVLELPLVRIQPCAGEEEKVAFLNIVLEGEILSGHVILHEPF